jgi:hypothetical protein
MGSPTLKRFALYALQAILWGTAMLIGLAILGGLTYFHEATRNQYEDMWSEIRQILRNEMILVGLGTTLLFWIGTVRTYMTRMSQHHSRS